MNLFQGTFAAAYRRAEREHGEREESFANLQSIVFDASLSYSAHREKKDRAKMRATTKKPNQDSQERKKAK